MSACSRLSLPFLARGSRPSTCVAAAGSNDATDFGTRRRFGLHARAGLPTASLIELPSDRQRDGRLPQLPLPALRRRTATEPELDEEALAPRHDRTAVFDCEPEQQQGLDAASARELLCALPLAQGPAECAICLETGEGEWRRLPCGHCFHGSCLCGMLRCSQHRRCPLCREELQPAPAAPPRAGRRLPQLRRTSL